MKAKLPRIFVTFALTGAVLCLLIPAGGAALAAARGRRQAQSAQVPSGAQAGPAATRQSLVGTWKFNPAQSDDPAKKFLSDTNVPLAQVEMSVPAAGLLPQDTGGMGGMGGGMGGVGSMPPAPPAHGWETDKDRQKRLESVAPAASLIIEQKDNEFDFTDDRGRRLIFYTDGRKLRKSKDEKLQEFAALWKAGHLSYEEKLPPHGTITRSFELSFDGRQMYETTEIDNGSAAVPIFIRYVYDAAPAGAGTPAHP